MEKIKTVAAALLLGVIFVAVERITYELVFLLLLLLLLPSCKTEPSQYSPDYSYKPGPTFTQPQRHMYSDGSWGYSSK